MRHHMLLSVLCGHHRYAHVSVLRGDRANAPLLGLSRMVSEDSVRRGLAKGRGQAEGEAAVGRWQQHHLRESDGPLLSVPWILDIDSVSFRRSKPLTFQDPGPPAARYTDGLSLFGHTSTADRLDTHSQFQRALTALGIAHRVAPAAPAKG